jgi:hypothetical protein
LLVIVAGLWSPACAKVLDLDDFRDAIAELCRCNEGEDQTRVPQHGDRCEDVLAGRLENVTPQAREAWLEFFVDNCQDSCENAYLCYQQDATCTRTNCTGDPRECCEYTPDVTCGENEFGDVVCVYPDGGGS